MDIDLDKIDDAVLALLQLTLHGEFRAWSEQLFNTLFGKPSP